MVRPTPPRPPKSLPPCPLPLVPKAKAPPHPPGRPTKEPPAVPTPPRPERNGLTRRAWLQVGYAGFLGLGLSSLAGRSESAQQKQPRRQRKAKSVILVFLTGAPSHLDTFDPKP